MARYLIAAALVAAVTTQATVGHGPAMEAAIRAATSASSRTRIHPEAVCNQVVAAAIGDPGLVVRRGTLMVDSVDGTPSLAGVCELPTSVLRSGSSPDITDQPGVLMSELHEREVDGEEEVAERRARATDGKEAEVVVAGRWEGLAA